MDKVDWILLLTILILSSYVVWLLMADEESVESHLAATYRLTAIMCQRLARTFGELGISAEIEYHRILESNRMI